MDFIFLFLNYETSRNLHSYLLIHDFRVENVIATANKKSRLKFYQNLSNVIEITISNNFPNP